MLKQLLQLLLNTRTTPEQAAHNAMPSAGRTDFTPTQTESDSWSRVCDGIAPHDGIVIAEATGKGNGYLSVATSGGNNYTYSLNNGEGMGMSSFIAKGQVFYVAGKNIKDVSVKITKLIGGGYKHIIWRALSCLRPSFNYLPRSFCKAKNLGFQNNQLLLSIRALIFLAQAPRISLPTPHRATAGRLLGAIQLQSQLLKSKSRTGRWHLLPYLTETLRELESVVTLKKGHRLSSCAVAEVQPIILFGSTKQVQTFNPLTGGALC